MRLLQFYWKVNDQIFYDSQSHVCTTDKNGQIYGFHAKARNSQMIDLDNSRHSDPIGCICRGYNHWSDSWITYFMEYFDALSSEIIECNHIQWKRKHMMGVKKTIQQS